MIIAQIFTLDITSNYAYIKSEMKERNGAKVVEIARVWGSEEERRALKDWAKRLGISVSALGRRKFDLPELPRGAPKKRQEKAK